MAEQDVVVVGAGPVGLLTALGLARAGVKVTVLEAAASVTTASRNLWYNDWYQWPALSGLAQLGVLPDALAAGFTETIWEFQVRETGERFTFDLGLIADDVPYAYNLNIAQSRMSELLLAHLATHAHATVHWSTAVTQLQQDADGVTVLGVNAAGEATFRAGWVVGADGAKSTVRREMGLGLVGMTWPERFIACDVTVDFGKLGYAPATYVIKVPHPALVSKMDAGRWRFMYAESRLLPQESIPERMEQVLRDILPNGTEPGLSQWGANRMHERCADRFRVDRALLTGDAAHLTNPLTANGVLCGLFDAFAVVEALVAVISEGADQDVLDRYASIRRQVFLEVAAPQSVAVKQLVLRSATDDLDKDLEPYRHAAADPSVMREQILLSGLLAGTSPLVAHA